MGVIEVTAPSSSAMLLRHLGVQGDESMSPMPVTSGGRGRRPQTSSVSRCSTAGCCLGGVSRRAAMAPIAAAPCVPCAVGGWCFVGVSRAPAPEVSATLRRHLGVIGGETSSPMSTWTFRPWTTRHLVWQSRTWKADVSAEPWADEPAPCAGGTQVVAGTAEALAVSCWKAVTACEATSAAP